MIADPWLHMIQQFEPVYDKLKRIMEEGPNFKVELNRLGDNKYQILIREVHTWHTIGLVEFGDLDEKCVWAADQLELWPDCRRVAWDMWQFKYRKDAAKFKTLFTLKWAQ